MLSRRKGIIIILTALLSALSTEILLLLYHRFYGSDFADVLFDIGLTRWGWLPALLFAAAAMTATIYWKPGGRVLQVLLILLAAGTFGYASLWLFGLYFISNLKP
jgi:hypothetical protein